LKVGVISVLNKKKNTFRWLVW